VVEDAESSSTEVCFKKDFTQPDPISETCRDHILHLLTTGRLFRYQTQTAEHGSAVDEAEAAIARYTGARYAVGVNSCGCGLFLALKSLHVGPGDFVLTNAWTLAPVPGAVAHTGAQVVLVDCLRGTHSICVADLERKWLETVAQASAQQPPRRVVLLMSYMRGVVPDMEAVLNFVKRHNVDMVEDCAHTLGVRWRGRMLGTLGAVGVYSTQTNKIINSGEGGFIVTNRDDIIERAVIHSGSYGHFKAHKMLSSANIDRMSALYQQVPNFSMRMHNVAATLVLSQICSLDDKIAVFNKHLDLLKQDVVANHVSSSGDVLVRIETLEDSDRGDVSNAHTSFQFNVLVSRRDNGSVPKQEEAAMLLAFSEALKGRGVSNAWFGSDWTGFTSTYKHWKYTNASSEGTDEFLDTLIDIPLYRTASWSDEDFLLIARIINDEALALANTASSVIKAP